MNSFDEIFNAIKTCDSFYVTGHINPDGDSIGSCECLKIALQQLGKDVDNLNAECFIQVDLQPEYRIVKEAFEIKKNAKLSICFDHHQIEDSNCDLSYIDPSAASNTLIIWDFINFIGIDISNDMAQWAYYGLCSDTNSFRNTNTDIRSFKSATDMMKYGVNAAEVAKELFQSRSFESFELEKLILDRLYVDKSNRFAFSYLTYDDYFKFNATKDDSDTMIDLIRELECVDVACVIRQEKTGDKIHGSLRSKNNIDVSRMAKLHKGGGHKAAAGFTMDETDMERAIEIIKSQLVDLMQSKI